uniref:RNA-directed RNA polymerase n=1 Tax=Tongren Reovi tick virus 1 TaxID=2972307 RepID=A0A9E7V271_9REOV|nr:MAG: putative RNA-dependent RNA polymerase [Tongren Reovi tick virus 1]
MVDRVDWARECISRLFGGTAVFSGDKAFCVLSKYSQHFHLQEHVRSKSKKKNYKVRFRGRDSQGHLDLGDLPSDFEPYTSSHWRGAPLYTEATWEDISLRVQGRSSLAVQIFVDSLVDLDQLQPEEEFLRNYSTPDSDHPFYNFAHYRSSRESAVYGDLPLRHWFHLLTEIARRDEREVLGLQALAEFVDRFGPPLHQDTRTLSKIEVLYPATMVPLFVESCLTESLIELSTYDRLHDLSLKRIGIAGQSVDPIILIREHFLTSIPHPKYINNQLRASYSWFVKVFGTSAPVAKVLASSSGDDCNSKNVSYQGFKQVRNPFGVVLGNTQFARDSLEGNLKKIHDALDYARSLARDVPGLPHFLTLYRDPMRQVFLPDDDGHVFLLSLLLAIQTMSGYGRAWVLNKTEDPATFMAPSPTNRISRVAQLTEEKVFQACQEAKDRGYEMVKAKDVPASLIKLAKNTASGLKTNVRVRRRFGTHATDVGSKGWQKITSGKKALVILTHGAQIMTKPTLTERYDTPVMAQRKGTRDVPIKATREIYAVSINALAPQLVLSLPLNDHFSHSAGREGAEPWARGTTSPSSSALEPKLIAGDLEATGSRLVDAADTFHQTSLPDHVALALDYSSFDKHMTPHNFRNAMRAGLLRATGLYPRTPDYTYDGLTLSDLVESGYGVGRAEGTLWDGNRRVFRMRREAYDALPEHARAPPDEPPFFKPPPGVLPLLNLTYVQEDPLGEVLVCATDGSDLARVYTHLSGENSTLVMNSLHNMAIGAVIQEELQKTCPGILSIISEMYVGDDTLMYLKFHTTNADLVDKAINTIFAAVEACGHEASPAKTTICALSTEKTQTHAKQGVYIPQDRMMVISSEREKNIEDVSSYLRSSVATFVTKVSRGFSHRLAEDILMFKASMLGYRKMKNIVHDEGSFRLRDLVADAGFTTVVVRDPAALFAPLSWGGFGVYPGAINVVMTDSLLAETISWGERTRENTVLAELSQKTFLPHWNESNMNASSLEVEADTYGFHRFTRPAVATVLSNPVMREAAAALPLGRFSPVSLHRTMLRDALLKEPRARVLLAPAYEIEYLEKLRKMQPTKAITLGTPEGGLTLSYATIFSYEAHFTEVVPLTDAYPDRNLSPAFLSQRRAYGVRQSSRLRITFIDQIEKILRRDGIMRGFVTSNDILEILAHFPGVADVKNLTFLLSLLNLTDRVAEQLATFLLSGSMRLDSVALNRDGVGGDEFTMSLAVCDQEFVQRYIAYPMVLSDTERLALALHTGQVCLAYALTRQIPNRMRILIPGDYVKEFKAVRRALLMKRRDRVEGVRNLLSLYLRPDMRQLHEARLMAFP